MWSHQQRFDDTPSNSGGSSNEVDVPGEDTRTQIGRRSEEEADDDGRPLSDSLDTKRGNNRELRR